MAELFDDNRTISSEVERIEWVKKCWKNFLFFAQNLPENNKKSIESSLKKEIEDLTIFLTDFGPTKSNFIRSTAQKYFTKNPMNFLETYKAVIDATQKDKNYFSKFNPYTYSYNPINFRTQFLVELIIDTRKANPQLKPGTKEEFKILQINLGKCDKLFEKRLKREYIQLLVRLGEFIEKFDFLKDYTNTFENKLVTPLDGSNYARRDENDNLIDNTLKGLSYQPHKTEANCISLDSVFSENYLNNLKFPKLVALAGFWINKVTKQIESLNDVLFLTNEFNLWKYTNSNKKTLPLDDQQIKATLIKTKFLSQLEDNLFKKVESLQLESPTLSQETIHKIFSNHFKQTIRKKEINYKKRFDRSLPEIPNELNHDLAEFHEMSNTRYLLYRLKDICILNMVMGSIDHKFSRNWGITSCNRNKTNIVFDVEGLILPLQLHIPTNKLLAFCKEYTDSSVIQFYKGIKDFSIKEKNAKKDKLIKSDILAPICSKQKTFINSIFKENVPLSPSMANFLMHIRFLSDNSKLPPSIKNENPYLPNALDLETGETLHIQSKEKNR